MGKLVALVLGLAALGLLASVCALGVAGVARVAIAAWQRVLKAARRDV